MTAHVVSRELLGEILRSTGEVAHASPFGFLMGEDAPRRNLDDEAHAEGLSESDVADLRESAVIVARPSGTFTLVEAFAARTRTTTHVMNAGRVVFVAAHEGGGFVVSSPRTVGSMIDWLVRQIGHPDGAAEEPALVDLVSLNVMWMLVRAGLGRLTDETQGALARDRALALLASETSLTEARTILDDLEASELIVTDGEHVRPGAAMTRWRGAMDFDHRIEIHRADIVEGRYLLDEDLIVRALFVGPIGDRHLVWPNATDPARGTLSRPDKRALVEMLSYVLGTAPRAAPTPRGAVDSFASARSGWTTLPGADADGAPPRAANGAAEHLVARYSADEASTLAGLVGVVALPGSDAEVSPEGPPVRAGVGAAVSSLLRRGVLRPGSAGITLDEQAHVIFGVVSSARLVVQAETWTTGDRVGIVLYAMARDAVHQSIRDGSYEYRLFPTAAILEEVAAFVRAGMSVSPAPGVGEWTTETFTPADVVAHGRLSVVTAEEGRVVAGELEWMADAHGHLALLDPSRATAGASWRQLVQPLADGEASLLHRIRELLPGDGDARRRQPTNDGLPQAAAVEDAAGGT